MLIRLLILFFFTTNFMHAQFPNVKWEYFIGAPAFGSAAAADMDDDGFYEIVFTTYTNDGMAHCLNAEDGSVKWTFDIGGCGDVAPIIYDMNSDGILDVVINGSCNPTLFCINGKTGELIWSKPSGGGDSPPTVADIDNDGKPEVVFGNFNGQVRIYNGEDGSTAKIIQANPFFSAIQTEPTLVDIDQDGDLEFIVTNYFNDDGLHIWAFDYETAEVIWTNTVIDASADYHAYHGGAVADLDGDGNLEYVVGSFNGDVRAINVEDGSEHWTIHIPESSFMAISIADIEGDGNLEVIVNNNDWITLDQRMWILSGEDGSVEWSYPLDFVSFRGSSISDINGNGILDLISGHFMGGVTVIEPYTGLIWEVDLLDYFSNSDQLPYFEADHQPLIADFDHNGTLDVFVVGGYGTYEPDSLNTGKAFMIEAGIGTCPEWLMFRHDISRSGYISTEEIDEACNTTNVNNNTNSNNINLNIYPNPSDREINIEYHLKNTSKVTLNVFDVLGKKVDEIFKGEQTIGDYHFKKNYFEKLSKGIYFCHLKIDDEIWIHKITLVD